VFEEAVEVAGEVALEAAARFASQAGARRGMWSASATAQVGVEPADSVLRERRRDAGEPAVCAVVPRLRECCTALTDGISERQEALGSDTIPVTRETC